MLDRTSLAQLRMTRDTDYIHYVRASLTNPTELESRLLDMCFNSITSSKEETSYCVDESVSEIENVIFSLKEIANSVQHTAAWYEKSPGDNAALSHARQFRERTLDLIAFELETLNKFLKRLNETKEYLND